MLLQLPQNVTTVHVLWQMLQKYWGMESGDVNEVSTVLLQMPCDRIMRQNNLARLSLNTPLLCNVKVIRIVTLI